jgi:phosphatidylserine decarboxylase
MNLSELNFSIHQDGYKFIGICAATTLVFMAFSAVLAFFGLIITLFCILFFRNPKRAVPSGDALIVSPADGTVCGVNFEVPPPEYGLGDSKRYRVSVFLSVFNVHVNRVPIAGKIRSIIYSPGSFINASLDKASLLNEKNTIVVEMTGESDSLMAFTQIAGMIARRIVCDVHEGQSVEKGASFGMIRFGSRCDVWLPEGAIPLVFDGQTMIAGESVLSDMAIREGVPRSGTVI